MRDRHHARMLACHHRWPTIVAAMRRLIGSYKDGVGGDSIVLVDNHGGNRDELTATVSARDGQMFVLAVDDGDLWLRASGNGQAERERRIGIERSDAATAAYVLEDWLSRLYAPPTIHDRLLRRSRRSSHTEDHLADSRMPSERTDVNGRSLHAYASGGSEARAVADPERCSQ